MHKKVWFEWLREAHSKVESDSIRFGGYLFILWCQRIIKLRSSYICIHSHGGTLSYFPL